MRSAGSILVLLVLLVGACALSADATAAQHGICAPGGSEMCRASTTHLALDALPASGLHLWTADALTATGYPKLWPAPATEPSTSPPHLRAPPLV